MSSNNVAILVFAVVAASIAAGFLLVWWRDKRNADDVAHDEERQHTGDSNSPS